MTRLHALTRPATALAGTALALASALPALALAQGAVPVQSPPPPDPASAWPLGFIVLLVAFVFLIGYLMARRDRTRHGPPAPH